MAVGQIGMSWAAMAATMCMRVGAVSAVSAVPMYSTYVQQSVLLGERASA